MLKQDIAAALEAAFSQHGFTEPSVATLQKLSGVSLRTLYKHYPSKQSMIIAFERMSGFFALRSVRGRELCMAHEC